VSRAARLGLVGLALTAAVGLGLLAWWLWPASDDDRPEVYAIGGPQPGDLSPGLDLIDNVRNYGIDLDIAYRFRTNALGFRGPEPVENGKPVLLVLGDSFAFGMGVDDGDTFADVLRRELASRIPDVVVHNASIPGYTIADQREQFEDRLHRLKPDIVVLCHSASDLKEMGRPTSFRRLMAWDDEEPGGAEDPEVDAIVARHGGEKSRATREAYVYTQRMLIDRLGAEAPRRLMEWRDRYIEEVIALSVRVKALGGRLVFVSWVDGYGMAGLTSEPVRAALVAAGVPVFNGSKRMLEQSEVPMDALFLPDGHLSVAGNRVSGVQTADWLWVHVIAH